MIPGEARGPCFEHSTQAALVQVLLNEVLRHVGDAVAGDRRLDLGKGGVEGQLPVDPDAKLLPLSPELPGIQAAAPRLAHVYAGVRHQLLRVLRDGMRCEVRGRGDGH